MKVISIINMKGGVAKTTLTINLADCLSRRRAKKVLIIDIDPQFNATQCVFSPDEYVTHIQAGGDTILNVFDRTERLKAGAVGGPKVVKPKKLDKIERYQISDNLHILPGNLELYRLEMAPGEGRENRLKLFLEHLRDADEYDIVLIDTPPTPSIWMTSALIASDYYLIPVKPDPISFTGIDLLQSVVDDKKENFGLKIECLGLVFTIVELGTKVYSEALKYVESKPRWKRVVFKKYLPKRTKIAYMQLVQEFILDGDDTETKQAMLGITDELLERI